MTTIHFHSDFYELIKSGKKTQTARIGEPHYNTGDATALFSNNLTLPITIKKVSYSTFNSLTTEQVNKDGFKSKSELWEALIIFYPDLKKSDLLMLVEFLYKS